MYPNALDLIQPTPCPYNLPKPAIESAIDLPCRPSPSPYRKITSQSKHANLQQQNRRLSDVHAPNRQKIRSFLRQQRPNLQQSV